MFRQGQTDLFNKLTVTTRKTRKTSGQTSNPWNGKCCESCWNALEDKCVCRCGGTYHGMGNPHVKRFKTRSSQLQTFKNEDEIS